MSLYIQKYGGTSVGSLDRIKSVAAHIESTYRQGHQLVVVVSAMGQQTDELLEMALKLSPNPSQREVDMLLSVGERISMSLLSIALNDLQVPTVSFTGSQSGILTDNRFGNARINRILGDRIRKALEDNKLVIVAGFQGMSEQEKEITTLGRGGSDLTAIALTHVLGADRCQIYKDVDGVCSADPRFVPDAKVLPHMSWDTLSALTWNGSGVVHNRGVHLAKKYGIPLEIRSSFNLETEGTMIGSKRPVEKAIVHALAHRTDLTWAYINGSEPAHLPLVLDQLAQLGENPLYIQQEYTGKESRISLVCSSSALPKLAGQLKSVAPQTNMETKQLGMTCVTAVGDGFWQEPELVSKALKALPSQPLLFDCKNSVLSIFLRDAKLDELLQTLHKVLIARA